MFALTSPVLHLINSVVDISSFQQKALFYIIVTAVFSSTYVLENCILRKLQFYILCCSIIVKEPDDVTVCESGSERVNFTCILDTSDENYRNIQISDVEWYRFIASTSITEMIENEGNIDISTSFNTYVITSLIINNAAVNYTGYYWVRIPSLTVCNTSLTVLTSKYVNRVNHTSYCFLCE